MSKTPSTEAVRAKAIFAGASPAPGELETLAKKLKGQQHFGLARRLLRQKFDEPGFQTPSAARLKVGQQLALNTYKDPDLPADERLEVALRILEQVGSLATTTDQETLGITGGVYKRKWESFGRKEDLERSLAYYKRGADQGAARDEGYTGINAAFVNDLLAVQDVDEDKPPPETAQNYLKSASALREDILANVPEPTTPTRNDWWKLVTIAEARIGLGRFRQAAATIANAATLPDVEDWEKETTTRQLVRLVRMREELPMAGQDTIGEAWTAVAPLVGGNVAVVKNAYYGRIGLALSGGGFRASLFHIGVLARLAEVDLLRGIGFISCVSGGSIIGAHYYLHVRHLLQTKSDAEITPNDYVEIVRKIADEFVAGVQRNIRTRVAAEWTTNLKMMLAPNYSRTLRVGELYERELFSRVADGEEGNERWLDALTIQPRGEAASFSPKFDNWKRIAKVPILVLNATTLNTGHNWQFTASWMGEPPGGINTEVDANYRLRRLYYGDAPPDHQKVRLGYAVAASSCVPGLFEPLPLEQLYPDRIVRLVDGGVQDNQGIGALLEQDCNVLVVSDASGQMDTIDDPSTGLLGVPLRATSIAQARIREAQYREAETRRRAGLLTGFVFLHLKKDLESASIDWIATQDPSEPKRPVTLTSYGVQKQVQRQLAAIRTDLDSFSDTESYALMASGYLMTETALRKPDACGFPVADPPRGAWKFLKLVPLMTAAVASDAFKRQLKIAEFIAFKVWRQSRMLQFGAAAVALILAVLLFFQWKHWYALPLPQLTLGALFLIVVAAALLPLVASAVFRAVRFPKTLQQIAIGFGMTAFGFIIARLHLHVFDKLFLRQGRVDP
jgi:predicted acylesterase/phospholipase RssA